MAKETIIHLIDDLDGSEAAETLVFGFRGTDYEVDLNTKNATALEKALTKYMDAGRRMPKSHTRGRASSGRSNGSGRDDIAAIRAWARDNRYDVSDRGRISAEVRAAYESNHR